MRSLSPPKDKAMLSSQSQEDGRMLENQSSHHRLMNQIVDDDHQMKLHGQAAGAFGDNPNVDRPKVLVGLGVGGALAGILLIRKLLGG